MLALIVRHAESQHNAGTVESPDSALSDLGRHQADRLAARLASMPIRAVYSSPYRRAILTALPLALRLGLPVRLRAELCEFFGDTRLSLAGFALPSADELSRTHAGVGPDPDGSFASAGEPWPTPGESLSDCIARQRRLVIHLRQRWTAEDDIVALFGHGLPVARFIEAWLLNEPGPAFRFVMENAAVNALRFARGTASLLCLNDIMHLAGMPLPRGSSLTPGGGFRPEPPASYW